MNDRLASAVARLASMPECARFRSVLADFAEHAAEAESPEAAIAAAPKCVRVLVLAVLGGYFDRAGAVSPRSMSYSNDTLLTEEHQRRQLELSRMPTIDEIVDMARAAQELAEGQP